MKLRGANWTACEFNSDRRPQRRDELLLLLPRQPERAL